MYYTVLFGMWVCVCIMDMDNSLVGASLMLLLVSSVSVPASEVFVCVILKSLNSNVCCIRDFLSVLFIIIIIVTFYFVFLSTLSH